MRFRRCQFAVITFLLLALCSGSVCGETNLALHKSYLLAPKPNYKGCTDDSDSIQLTDGKTFGCWWVKKTTVGWDRAARGIEIVIDLERLVPVDQVKVYSVGGGFAGMEFPEFIAVLVSKDGKKYEFAGLIGSEDLANIRSVGHNRVPHTFVIDSLNTQARYVKIVVRSHAPPPRFFVDEIEVIHKERRSGEKIIRRENLLKFDNLEQLLGAIEDYLQLRDNIRETLRVLQDNRNKFATDFFRKVSSELETLSEQFNLPTNEIHSQDKLFELRGKLGAIRAQIYRDIYKKPIVCFVADPMEILLEKNMHLVEVSKQQQFDIQLWQNEYESAAVNIINCSQEALDIVVSLSPLVSEDGTYIQSSKTFTVRRAVFVKGIGIGSIADALVLQPEKPFELPPGSVTQIWLTAFNPALAAGDYKGVLAVAASSKLKKLPIETIKLNLRVEDITFPEEITLNTCVWDMYAWFNPVTKHIMPTVSEDLRVHYINIAVLEYLIPFLKKKHADHYFRCFEKQLPFTDFARMYLLYFGWLPDQKDKGRFGEWMSPSWKREFSSWLRGLVVILRQRGIGYERFAVYPFDESLCDEFYQVASLIRQVDPKIKIFANNLGKGPKDFMRFKDLIDIWCPHRVHCKKHPEWLAAVKSFGKEVWTYGGYTKGLGKAKPAYGYYRLMAWDAFERGQTGAGFWIYIDRKANKYGWDDIPRASYSVIYGATNSPVKTHGEKIIPSRRWEAWREGVEDYEYLVQLQKAIDRTRLSDPEAADNAQKVLDLQVGRVVNNRADSGIVYSARRIISETLLRLRQGNRETTVNTLSSN